MVVAADRYLAEDAVRADPGRRTSRCRRWSASTPPAAAEHAVHDDVPDNVAAHMVQEVGDVDGRDRRRAAHARRSTWTSSGAPRCRWRARACYARWDADDRSLRVYSSTQTSTSVRAALAAKLGLPVDQVEVHRARRRRRLRREDHAPVAGGGAGAVGRDAARPRGQVDRGPARALHLVGPRARPAARRSRSASTTTAGCSALDVRFWHDNGAYTPYGIIVPDHHRRPSCSGPYKPGAYRVEFHSLYTNTVIVTPYRGAGRPQGVLRRWSGRWTRSPTSSACDRAEVRATQLHPARRDARTTTA